MSGSVQAGDSGDSGRDVVEFTKDQLDDILAGDLVQVGGYSFCKSAVFDEYDLDYHGNSNTWKKLRDREKEQLVWKEVRGVMADESQDKHDPETVEFTEDDISDILAGEYVHRGGHTFALPRYLDQPDVDWVTAPSRWRALLSSDHTDALYWPASAITGVLADPDADEVTIEHADDAVDHSEMSTIDTDDKQHVTMEVTVDVSDMDSEDREVIDALSEQYEDSFREVVEKNRDYGWSFLTTGSKLAQSAGTPFDSPVRSQAFGLLTRAGDKRERLVENVYGNGSATVSDNPSTTALEAANYYQFLAFVLANPELAQTVSDA